jgi:hypothetical protein
MVMKKSESGFPVAHWNSIISSWLSGDCFQEGRGTSGFTRVLLALGLFLVVFSAIIVG